MRCCGVTDLSTCSRSNIPHPSTKLITPPSIPSTRLNYRLWVRKSRYEQKFLGILVTFSIWFLIRMRYPMVTRPVMTMTLKPSAPVSSPAARVATPLSLTQPRPCKADQQLKCSPPPQPRPWTWGHTTTSTTSTWVIMARSIVSRCCTWSDVLQLIFDGCKDIVISEYAQPRENVPKKT